MASVSDYTFNKLANINDDSCTLSQQNVQNLKFGNYMLTNFYGHDCTMKKPREFATNQPSVFFHGGHQTGYGGCNIDENSDLFLSLPTKPACKISLQQRAFLTVPFLGRGNSDAVLESQIQQGDMVSDKKSICTTSEVSHMDYRNYPLIPSIQSTITNPSNLVESVAAEGWVRGGLPSRDLVRDTDYAPQHTNNQS